MTKEEYEDIRITREDLVDWIDRPPSNHDFELIDYLVNALDNQFKYYNIIEEAEKYVNNHIHQETFTGYMDSYELKQLLQILDKAKDIK